MNVQFGSMKGLVGMSWTSQRLQQIFNSNDDLLGGVPIIILVGDDGQIGPHGDMRQFSQIQLTDKNCARKAIGKAVFDLFIDVVILTECPRCKGDQQYLDLLLRLRDLDITQNDFQRLLKRTKYELPVREQAGVQRCNSSC